MLAVLYGSRIVTTSGLYFQPSSLIWDASEVSFISAVYLYSSISLASQPEAIQIQSSWFLTLQPVFPSGFFISSEKALLSCGRCWWEGSLVREAQEWQLRCRDSVLWLWFRGPSRAAGKPSCPVAKKRALELDALIGIMDPPLTDCDPRWVALPQLLERSEKGTGVCVVLRRCWCNVLHLPREERLCACSTWRQVGGRHQQPWHFSCLHHGPWQPHREGWSHQSKAPKKLRIHRPFLVDPATVMTCLSNRFHTYASYKFSSLSLKEILVPSPHLAWNL